MRGVPGGNLQDRATEIPVGLEARAHVAFERIGTWHRVNGFKLKCFLRPDGGLN
jgi:hypothetical protein